MSEETEKVLVRCLQLAFAALDGKADQRSLHIGEVDSFDETGLTLQDVQRKLKRILSFAQSVIDRDDLDVNLATLTCAVSLKNQVTEIFNLTKSASSDARRFAEELGKL